MICPNCKVSVNISESGKSLESDWFCKRCAKEKRQEERRQREWENAERICRKQKSNGVGGSHEQGEFKNSVSPESSNESRRKSESSVAGDKDLGRRGDERARNEETVKEERAKKKLDLQLASVKSLQGEGKEAKRVSPKNSKRGDRDWERGKEGIVKEEREKTKSPLDLMPLPEAKNTREDKDGGSRGKEDLKLIRILGVTRELGELHFFVERLGLEPELVPKREAYKQFPHLCLDYFESKLIWGNTL